jgi:hypothetical protein
MRNGGPDPDRGSESALPESALPDSALPDSAAASGPAAPRPLIERVGMAAIAAGVALLFVGMAVMSLAAGEPFLGVMSAIGAGMTAWVGLRTLLRG